MMKIYNHLPGFEFEKFFRYMASLGIIMVIVLITLVLIMFPIIANSDGILPADYPNAALIKKGSDDKT